MCEFSGKLIAWLDRELSEEEAVNVGWHVGRCPECRRASETYAQVSRAFLPCYEAAVLARPRKSRRRMLALIGAAAAILLAMALWPRPADKLMLGPPAVEPAPALAFERPMRATISVHGRRAAPKRVWIPEEPVIEIALPAEALFPPGAVPEGFSFIADVRTGP
jgi:Putative zinc-finger